MEDTLLDKEIATYEVDIDNQASKTLLTTAKYSKLLAIIGLIGTSLSILGSFALANTLQQTLRINNVIIPFLIVFFAASFYFPNFHLLRFSTNIKESIRKNDSDLFRLAFDHMRLVFKFYGYLMILSFILLIILGISSGASYFMQ
ncbi:MAG: hypothetical protein K1X55_00685 [Chitinophagales bacterium]|nr:hypothetical protein [Chitinophagales bacterium]